MFNFLHSLLTGSCFQRPRSPQFHQNMSALSLSSHYTESCSAISKLGGLCQTVARDEAYNNIMAFSLIQNFQENESNKQANTDTDTYNDSSNHTLNFKTHNEPD